MRTLRVSLPLVAGAVLASALAACSGAPSSAFNQAGYYVRGDTVYYLHAFPGKADEIVGADPDSFTILDATYAKDRSTVYRDGAALAGADAASFELMEEPDYSRDANHVYLNGSVLTDDVEHFDLDGADGFPSDSEHVYWSDGSVLSDDPEHFEGISSEDYYTYVKDSTTVYVNSNPIKGADPQSFAVIDGGYAKDAGSIFYFDRPVREADSSSFEVLEETFARDARHAYWQGTIIPGADVSTFRVLNGKFECTADAEHGYYRDVQIEGFDPATIPEGSNVTNCTETFVGTYP